MTPRFCPETQQVGDRKQTCGGRIDDDGYCGTCGTLASAEPQTATGGEPATPPGARAETSGTGTVQLGSARAGGTRRRTSSTRTVIETSGMGAGIVEIPAEPLVDPTTAVLENPIVAEEKRFCAKCGHPVGRSRDGEPGRLHGYCPNDGFPYDFRPKLNKGEPLRDGQYEVLGCLAHGGLGWVYLARDQAVDRLKHLDDGHPVEAAPNHDDSKMVDLYVAIKGLLNAGDREGMAVAVAEARFLSQIEHPNIVRISTTVTHDDAGYIVMEYVGGPSLKEILERQGPLPVEQAIAYILAVLPAFSYLHDRSLVYCDLKPENLILKGNQVKLIDLGAVRRVDDPSGDVYGTRGFHAPEIAKEGPSVASDLYTLGRTLAVLTLDFDYKGRFRHSLPDPAAHSGLARFESFHRFLLKATAPDPGDRFQSAAEMGDQLLGVLREVVALSPGLPHGPLQPALSAVFGPVADDEALAPLAIDAADPAAAFLVNLSGGSQVARLKEIDGAIAAGKVVETVEVRLWRAAALIDIGEHGAARAYLGNILADDPWEWRAVWLSGVAALATEDLAIASAAFDYCWTEVPGELVPKLAAAFATEQAGSHDVAAWLYEVVVGVDPSYVAAARGLARCKARAGDVVGELAAYDRIPPTHRAYAAAQLDAVRTLIRADRYPDAGTRLDRLEVDDLSRAQLEVELFEGAVDALKGRRLRPSAAASVIGCPFEERSLAFGLEGALRSLARRTPDPTERCRTVDRANRVRPLTLL